MKELTVEEREVASHLKATIYLSVSKIIEEQIQILSEEHGNISTTPRFVASLVELVYNQVVSLGEDLESFAIHGGRSTITPKDMFMVTRRNEILTQVLKEIEAGLQ